MQDLVVDLPYQEVGCTGDLEENLVLTTPAMRSKGFLAPEDMVLVDLDGRHVAGALRATSEVRIHLYIYRERPDVRCVVHAHPPHATAFAVVGRTLPRCVLAEAEVNLGLVPLAPYATTGTWEFARSIAPWVRTHDVFLLANHGALCTGHDPFDAYYRMETLDQYARILLLAMQAGDVQSLDHRAMEELLNLKERMRIADPRRRAGVAECCDDVPPAPARPEADALRFAPASQPVTDSPKPGTKLLPSYERESFSPARPELEDEVREILRRAGIGR